MTEGQLLSNIKISKLHMETLLKSNVSMVHHIYGEGGGGSPKKDIEI